MFLGINSNAGLVLAEEYPKVTSSTALPAFNRLSTLHTNSHHRSASYTVPSSSNYNDWQYTEPASALQYNILSPGATRSRPLSASASLSASKLILCQGLRAKSFFILSALAETNVSTCWELIFMFAVSNLLIALGIVFVSKQITEFLIVYSCC